MYINLCTILLVHNVWLAVVQCIRGSKTESRWGWPVWGYQLTRDKGGLKASAESFWSQPGKVEHNMSTEVDVPADRLGTL